MMLLPDNIRGVTRQLPAHRPRNFMASVGFGSFAYVGVKTALSPPTKLYRLYLAVEVGNACQLRCRHCIYGQQMTAERPRPETLKGLRVGLADGLNPMWVSLAGKEPTLFPAELVETARAVQADGRVVFLMTNGLRLQGALLEDLLPLVDCFDISLDGDREAHDWMRGAGTFDRTFRVVERLVEKGAKIGVIATAVHRELDVGRGDPIARLAKQLHERFGDSGQVSLAVSLYYGPPDDPLLLSATEISELIVQLRDIGLPMRVLMTAQYARFWQDVADRLEIGATDVVYDIATGFPLVRSGSVDVLLFNLAESTELVVRLSNEGDIFVGCNHLTLAGAASRHRVGALSKDRLVDVCEALFEARHPTMGALGELPSGCSSCDRLSSCRAGDQLSGLLFNGIASDPYCERLGGLGA